MSPEPYRLTLSLNEKAFSWCYNNEDVPLINALRELGLAPVDVMFSNVFASMHTGTEPL